MTVLARLGVVDSRRYAFELVKPSSIAKTGASSTATVSALGSVEFSLCDSLSLNGVFSSAYDNYMVVVQCVSTGDRSINYRLRLAGSDNSTASSYVTQALIGDNTSVTGSRGAATTLGELPGVSTSNRSAMVAYFYGPALAQPTAVRGVGIYGGSGGVLVDRASTHNQSTAYDGFTFSLVADTFSGRVAVYGMRG